MIRAALIAALVATGGVAAAATDPATTAADAAERLREANIALVEAERSSDRVRALTETIRAYEDGLGALREALRGAALRERAIRQILDAESGRLARVLGALQSIGRTPEATLLLHPSGATGTARASMLMAEVVPTLEAEVAALRGQLEELRVLTLLRTEAIGTLQGGLDGVQEARTALSKAISERTDLPPSLATDEAAMQALLDSAETLDGFASTLTDEAPAPAGDFAAARGALPLPVAGALVAGFRERDASGLSRPGLLIATAPRAMVSAPWPGTVRYAGPLLDYGNVIILEPEDGYLLVFAGLSDVFVHLDQVVASGDPLALMGGETPAAQEILIETADGGGQSRSETLYMELRTGDGPVDPADWYALGRE